MSHRSLLQLSLTSGGCLGSYGLLQVGVQALVGVELWAVGRQIKYLQVLHLLRQPFAYHLGMVHPEVVQDQEHLALGRLDEPFEEPNQDLGIQGAIKHHPADLTLVRHRRDQRETLSVAAHLDHRSPSLGRVAAAPHVIGAQSGFVSPVDLGSFSFSALRDRRVILLQPSLHRRRSLLVGFTDRLLRRKAPTLKIVTDRAHRKLDAELLVDQVPDRRASPQRIGQLQLIRGPVADHRANGLFLLLAQGTTVAYRATPRLHRYGFPAARFVRLHRRDDRPSRQAYGLRHRRQIHSAQPKLHRLSSSLVEYLGRKPLTVGRFHEAFILHTGHRKFNISWPDQ